jgi:hypothetical protein
MELFWVLPAQISTRRHELVVRANSSANGRCQSRNPYHFLCFV